MKIVVVVPVRPYVSRHHFGAWDRRVHSRPVISEKREVNLLDLSESKEFLKKLGEIIHLGHDDILPLILVAVVTLGSTLDKGGGEGVFLIIGKWHKHFRGHISFLSGFPDGR
jgi:hypothetical protein